MHALQVEEFQDLQDSHLQTGWGQRRSVQSHVFDEHMCGPAEAVECTHVAISKSSVDSHCEHTQIGELTFFLLKR